MENGGIDFFSHLPDSVIARIFYFLPMQESMQTCILSRNLSRLCTSIPNLEFKDLLDSNVGSRTNEKWQEILHIINKFLEHHEGPIRSCRFSFCHEWYIAHIARWIILLMQYDIEELDLDLLLDPHMHIELPSCVFSSKSLKVLKLKSCSLKLPPKFTGLSSLETLVFRDMTLSDDLICIVLSQCSLLQSLTFQNCKGFQKLKTSNGITSLRSLTLDSCPSRIQLDGITSDNLCLHSEKSNFYVRGASNVPNVQLFRVANHPVNQQEAIKMRNVLPVFFNSQSLSLTGWAFKSFAASRLPEELCTYVKLTKLEVEMSSWNVKELEGLFCLLRSCPHAEELVVWINDAIASGNEYGNNMHEFGDPHNFWEEREEMMDYGCLRNSLLNIEINNFTGWDCDVEFVKFLVTNTRWLKTMTINPIKEMDPNQQLGFGKLFSRMPKTCIDSKIVVNQV